MRLLGAYGRKFVEALPSDKSLLPTSKAAEGVEWCNRLYATNVNWSNYRRKNIKNTAGTGTDS